MADPPIDPDDDTGTPRWVKVFGIIALVVALLFVALMLFGGSGGHGPRRHLGSCGGGGISAPGDVSALGIVWAPGRGEAPTSCRASADGLA